MFDLRPRPVTIAAEGGIDLARLLASWTRSGSPVHVALLPLEPAMEAANALELSGAGYLVLARPDGSASIWSARPFPHALHQYIRERGRTSAEAYTREMQGALAALIALVALAADPRPDALAGGPWGQLTTPPGGA